MINFVPWKEKFLHMKFRFLSSGKMPSIRAPFLVEKLA
jgi:hypothetical protein